MNALTTLCLFLSFSAFAQNKEELVSSISAGTIFTVYGEKFNNLKCNDNYSVKIYDNKLECSHSPNARNTFSKSCYFKYIPVENKIIQCTLKKVKYENGANETQYTFNENNCPLLACANSSLAWNPEQEWTIKDFKDNLGSNVVFDDNNAAQATSTSVNNSNMIKALDIKTYKNPPSIPVNNN